MDYKKLESGEALGVPNGGSFPPAKPPSPGLEVSVNCGHAGRCCASRLVLHKTAFELIFITMLTVLTFMMLVYMAEATKTKTDSPPSSSASDEAWKYAVAMVN